MENFLYGKGHYTSGKNKSLYNEKISLPTTHLIEGEKLIHGKNQKKKKKGINEINTLI